MATDSFKEGDIVKLKSGGPPMTIEMATGDGLAAKCMWFAPNGEGGWTGPYRETFYQRFLRTF